MAKIAPGCVGTTCQWKLVYQVYTMYTIHVPNAVIGLLKMTSQENIDVEKQPPCTRAAFEAGEGLGTATEVCLTKKNKIFTFLTNFSFYPPLWPKKVLEIKQHFLDPHLPVWQEKACGEREKKLACVATRITGIPGR